MYILIVDDSSQNSYQMRTIFEANGHSVNESPNGKDALEKILENRFDLILSEILMPVMDGFSLCRIVRKLPELKKTPLILYSATAIDPRTELLAQEIGADRFIPIPCESTFLLSTIHEVVAGKKYLTENQLDPLLLLEAEVLKLYQERMVKKLEQKVVHTEKKLLENLDILNTVRRNETLLSQALSLNKIGAWEWNPQTQELFWTEETFLIHDLALDTPITGKTRFDLSIACYTEEKQAQISEAIQLCLINGEPFSLDSNFTSLTGRQLYIRTKGKALFENNTIIKIIGSLQDITDEKQAEIHHNNLKEQLIQSQKLDSLGEFANTVAHNFNNNLTVILGYCDLVLNQPQERIPLQKEIQEIMNAGNCALDLTRQLQTFSRKQEIKPITLNLNFVLNDLDKTIYRAIGDNICLISELDESLWNVKADPTQMEQVIMNLVMNAKEAMPEGGNLFLVTSNKIIDQSYSDNHLGIKPCNFVMLEISDTGIGMDKETVARVFEPFYTTKNTPHNSGLGLATVYGIIKQAEGFIWVYSEPGKGTSFKILLPVAEDENISDDIPDETSNHAGNGEFILVVEDNVYIRVMIDKILTGLGYKTRCFENAEMALLSINDKVLIPDLIITDIIMPGMNGREFTNLVHQMYPGIKILFMSGYTDSIISQIGVSASEIPFIQKPFTQKDLAVQIKTLLQKNKQSLP